MVLWRRRPKETVIVHSDQGVQYTSGEWRSYLKDNNMEAIMSRRLTSNLPNKGRWKVGRVRLHRTVLQSKTSSWEQWERVTHGLRR